MLKDLGQVGLWLSRQGLDVADLDEGRLNQHLADLWESGRRRVAGPRGLVPLLTFLPWAARRDGVSQGRVIENSAVEAPDDAGKLARGLRRQGIHGNLKEVPPHTWLRWTTGRFATARANERRTPSRGLRRHSPGGKSFAQVTGGEASSLQLNDLGLGRARDLTDLRISPTLNREPSAV
ncbi:hypothetical protein ACGFYY_35220 [Streptomyces sp. NPDC048331]|uniref:hypothetical protein n=1 Tax=Streptomyces sp. NPDC048331 TaxID=3365534 RepID=UPI0037222AC0